MTANTVPHLFEGITVQRGQRVIRVETLADALGLEEAEIRRALNALWSIGEITVERKEELTVVTLVNYDLYQSYYSSPPPYVENDPYTEELFRSALKRTRGSADKSQGAEESAP